MGETKSCRAATNEHKKFLYVFLLYEYLCISLTGTEVVEEVFHKSVVDWSGYAFEAIVLYVHRLGPVLFHSKDVRITKDT